MGTMTQAGSDLSLRVDQLVDITDFKLKDMKTVGHLNSITVGSQEISTDFHVLDPMNPKADSKVDCAGLITFAQWNKKPGGIMVIEGRICEGGYGILQGALDNVEEEAQIKLKFNIYKYHSKGYYKGFHTDEQEIEGFISADGYNNVEDQPATDYKLIPNHQFTLAIIGSDEKDQDLHVAYGPDQKFVLKYGQKAGA